ncbi:uncharacterized protein YALI1_D32933g [Yarrowia lipolytica]|uniref:Uncharacterized protein n=1 Tax=Yarrowia lipolytica TaxID=4952 RepID=A0A1D8NG27_YARLL|nr:hypothetical protein YALI1_D32933g [Yarrowia lipolytica]
MYHLLDIHQLLSMYPPSHLVTLHCSYGGSGHGSRSEFPSVTAIDLSSPSLSSLSSPRLSSPRLSSPRLSSDLPTSSLLFLDLPTAPPQVRRGSLHLAVKRLASNVTATLVSILYPWPLTAVKRVKLQWKGSIEPMSRAAGQLRPGYSSDFRQRAIYRVRAAVRCIEQPRYRSRSFWFPSITPPPPCPG